MNQAAEAGGNIIYITGCDRSGTTLVDLLLGAHANCFSGGELWHLPLRGILNNELCSCGASFNSCQFWQSVLEAAGFQMVQEELAEIERIRFRFVRTKYIPLFLAPAARDWYLRQIQSYLDFMQALIAAIFLRNGGRVLIDSSKNPMNALLMSHIFGRRLALLQVVRDSRGVAHSWAKRRAKPEVLGRRAYMDSHSLAGSAILWLAANYGAGVALARHQGQKMLVRYEDVAADPVVVAGQILQRLVPEQGEAWGEAGLGDFTGARTHSVSGNPLRLEKGPLAVRIDDEWTSKMSGLERAFVTVVTVGLLRRYGYRRGGA